MIYECTLELDAEIIERLHYWLTDNSDASDRLNEDDTFIKTAKFKNGMEMDIKCCGVQFDDVYDNPADNTAWTEAVLFDPKGYEICHTDVSDEFLGDWELSDDNDNVYIAHVIERKN